MFPVCGIFFFFFCKSGSGVGGVVVAVLTTYVRVTDLIGVGVLNPSVYYVVCGDSSSVDCSTALFSGDSSIVACVVYLSID